VTGFLIILMIGYPTSAPNTPQIPSQNALHRLLSPQELMYGGSVSRYQLTVTGVPSISRDGVEVRIGRKKSVALLIYLVLDHNMAEKVHLAELLWPESRSNLKNLRTVISYLNGALGDTVIIREGSRVLLNRQVSLAVDVLEILNLVDLSSRILKENDRDHESIGLLERAVSLRNGRFLSGFTIAGSVEFDNWLLIQEYKFDVAMQNAFETLVSALESQSRYEQATRHAQRWVELDASNEIAHQALMRLYAYQKQRSAAVRQYRILERYLQEDMGTTPTSDTQFLYHSIQTGRYAPPPEHPVLLIFPFDSEGTVESFNDIAEGLTVEIIHSLSQFSGLRIASPSTSRRLKHAQKNIDFVHEELGVDYVVQGTVHIETPRVRVTALLTDVRSSLIIWSKRFLGEVEGFADIVNDITQAIVGELRIQVLPHNWASIRDRRPHDPQAYALYLQVRPGIYRRRRPALERALRQAEKCMDIVGENEILLALVGEIHLKFLEGSMDPNPRHIDEVRRCIDRVFAINPESGPGYFLSGYLHYRHARLQKAVYDFKKGLEREPDSPDILAHLVMTYVISGQIAAAEPLLERLLMIDPLTPLNHFWRGHTAMSEGRIEDAYHVYMKVHEMDPEDPFAGMAFGCIAIRAGRLEEGCAALEQLSFLDPDSNYAAHARFRRHAARGESITAINEVTPAMEAASRTSRSFAMNMANTYAMLKKRELAMDWLETAVDLGYLNYEFNAHHNQYFADLRTNDRFQAILRCARKARLEFEV
jgi:DNA-binding SARP family transcriptional activator/Flp pilus assembly protein TadD